MREHLTHLTRNTHNEVSSNTLCNPQSWRPWWLCPGAISSRTKRKRERSDVSQRTAVRGILLPLDRLLNYGIIACLATHVQGKTMQQTYPVVPVSSSSPPSFSASLSRSGASVSALFHSGNMANREKFSSSTGSDAAIRARQGRNPRQRVHDQSTPAVLSDKIKTV